MAQVLQPVLRTSVAPVWFPLAPVPPLAATSSKRGPATLASVTALAVHVRRKGRRAEVSRPSPLSATFDDSEVMKSLPSFISVPPDVLPVIRTFAEQHRNDTVVTWITGKRVQVYLSGEKSRPFLDYAKKHQHVAVLSFLEELKASLASLAAQEDGEASEDIAALVGAAEMQVPHTDLLPGQVQVILALTETSSTLVYDPKLPQPSRKEVAKIMGIAVKELAEDGQFGLVYQSFPLVLPVKDVYQNMVESYTAGPFRCGDAVQIKDGIVHAGPGCEDEAVDERVVIFMTYRTFRDEHYEFTFQAKLWDWASHPAIPPMVAYRRLQEVYNFGLQNGMDIKPWTYYPPESLEACKMLCTTPGLDEMTVELLVEEWREMLYDENIQIACANINYANFPLDTHAISINVTLKKWKGITAKVVSPVPEVKEVRSRSKDQKQEAWPRHVVAQDSIHLGDLNFVAWGVWSHHGPETSEGQREADQYELIMVMRRSFRRHFFTFFILSMAVLSGATSLFCPLSIDMLAGRLSINVTVLLSMVAFSVQRPSAIEAVPYNTIHDIFVQVCTLLTATLSLCNLATQLTCFEMTEGCDECVREDLPDLCALGSCGSKVLDCYFFYTLLLLLVFIDLGLLLWARHLRRAELRHFRALCRDLGAEQGSHTSFDCQQCWHWRCCRRCLPCCRRRVLPQTHGKVCHVPIVPRGKTKAAFDKTGSSSRGGVPCFFVRQKHGRFLPVQGGLCEMMQMEWKDALERSQMKDRAAMPLRRCVSRFSRASIGTNAFSRRLAQPTVLEGVETHYMDLGGGEVGYYRYCHWPDAPPKEQVTCMAGEKLEWPGLGEVLDPDSDRTAELCQSLVTYLVRETSKKNEKLTSPQEENAESEGQEVASASLLVGITGEVAAELSEGRRSREPLELFLEDLEDELCTASGKQWEIYYFLLRKEDEAFYERIAIGWLLENTDLKLTDTFAKDPKLEGYMRRQTTSWALLSGRKNIGQMEQDEFIERFMPLSRQATFERRAWEALEWFRVMDEDGSGTITVSEMLNCMLESEDLLQAVIRHRLFVGTLAGGPRSVQLTVAEPDPEKEGEVLMHYAKVGTRSPVLWGLFPQEEVTREVLLRWENLLVSVVDHVPLTVELEELDEAQHMSHLLQENHSQEWPSALRGIFVGISSMFYAARDAGITARLIQKKDCLNAFTTALEAELRDPKGAKEDPKKLQLHHQKVANLAMAHAFISRLLHDDAWLYFRRSWQMGQSSFIATWSLGVFLNGKRKDGHQAPNTAFTRVRSRLDEAVDAVELMEENKQHNWARRLSAALRFSARVRRSHSSSTMD